MLAGENQLSSTAEGWTQALRKRWLLCCCLRDGKHIHTRTRQVTLHSLRAEMQLYSVFPKTQ